MKSLLVLVFLLFQFVQSSAEILIDATKGKAKDFDHNKSIHRSIERSILMGRWDAYDLQMPIILHHSVSPQIRDKAFRGDFVLVSSQSFPALPKEIQEQIVSRLAFWDDNLTAYQASVTKADNKFDGLIALKRLKVDFKKLPAVIPAEMLLSEYAQRWAYKVSYQDGPNCLHTAMASIFRGWKTPMYVGAPTFVFYRGGYFKEIAAPTQWGDMIYFDLGWDDHAFTYLGRDRKDPSRSIVFTKNGYEQGHFLFMDYNDVVDIYRPIKKIRFFRAEGVESPPEPSEQKLTNIPRFLRGGSFPLIEAALKTRNSETFSPIRY